MSARLISGYLRDRDVACALIGAVALAARGHSRSTYDLDFLTVDKAVLKEAFWDDLRNSGARVEVRQGDFDDPLRGVVRITLPDGGMVDVVVAKYRWQQKVIDRAEPLDLGYATIPVPRASDLILLKLFAGGPQDLADVRALLDTPDRAQITAEVRENLSDLPPECSRTFDEQVGTPRER